MNRSGCASAANDSGLPQPFSRTLRCLVSWAKGRAELGVRDINREKIPKPVLLAAFKKNVAAGAYLKDCCWLPDDSAASTQCPGQLLSPVCKAVFVHKE
jgi:hypothetical protein